MDDPSTLTKQERWRRGVKRTGYITAAALVVCYLCTVIPLILAGITIIEMPTVAAVALAFLYPIFFFFFGMFVVMKKKIFPLMKQQREIQEAQQL